METIPSSSLFSCLLLPSKQTKPYLQTQHPAFPRKNLQPASTAAPPITALVLSVDACPKPRSQSSWIQALRSQTRSNQFREAISIYIDMIEEGIKPKNFAFPAALKVVIGIQGFNLGKLIHAAAVKHEYTFLQCLCLITFGISMGNVGLKDVLNLFDKMPQKDQVYWNSMIATIC